MRAREKEFQGLAIRKTSNEPHNRLAIALFGV